MVRIAFQFEYMPSDLYKTDSKNSKEWNWNILKKIILSLIKVLSNGINRS